MGRLHAGVPLGLGRPLVERWYKRGAGLVVLVVGLGLPLVGPWYKRGAGLVVLVVGPGLGLVGRWYNPGAAVGLAVPCPWPLPVAERGQAG